MSKGTNKIQNDDFVEIEFDIYANDKLVQTTDEKKGKEAGLNIETYGPHTIIVGKAFVLKALDDEILKSEDPFKEKTLQLKPEEAYGKRLKEYIKVLPKSAFDEHKLKAVVGMVYDFNGTYGTVKSIVGGRVMVDFNNPLAGKDIKLKYKVIKKVTDIAKKVSVVLHIALQIPNNLFTVKTDNKKVILSLPEELGKMKDLITKSIEKFVPEIKDYSIIIENFKKQ